MSLAHNELNHRGLNKMNVIFQTAKFIDCVPKCISDKQINIGFVNGLATKRWQAILCKSMLIKFHYPIYGITGKYECYNEC